MRRSSSSVRPTRPQNGHWKSLNSTMVTGASGLPHDGSRSLTGTTAASSFAAGWETAATPTTGADSALGAGADTRDAGL